MARVCLGAWLVGVMLSVPATATAQAPYTGIVTAHVGAARGGDVRDVAATAGGSMAVIDRNGVGAEIDVAHTGRFDDAFFAESSVTSFMVNFLAAYPDERLRPFVTIGAGLMRLRTALSPAQDPTGHTEAAWNAGGGAFVVVNESLWVRADVRYFRLFERPTELILRDEGFFDYWRTSVGVTFSWPIR